MPPREGLEYNVLHKFMYVDIIDYIYMKGIVTCFNITLNYKILQNAFVYKCLC